MPKKKKEKKTIYSYSVSWDQWIKKFMLNKIKNFLNPSTVFSYQMLKPAFSHIDTTKSPHSY